MVPDSDAATTARAFGWPRATSSVPSSGSTATSTATPWWVPMRSPLKSIGASSFSPSPITTTPSISTVASMCRIASTAARSAAILSPNPTQRPQASAAASVTRTSSSARFRSGASTTGAPPGDGNAGEDYIGPHEPIREAADPLVREQRLDPAGGDRRGTVACPCQGAGDGAVRVRVAAQVDREHDRRLDVRAAERGREPDPKRRQDEPHPLLRLGREDLL